MNKTQLATIKIKAVHGHYIKLVGKYVEGKLKNSFNCITCGHVWQAHYSNVTHSKKPTGCPNCSKHLHVKKTKKDIAKLIKQNSNSGVSLISEYLGMNKKATFKCKLGHIFTTIVKSVAKNTTKSGGCKSCAAIETAAKLKHSKQTVRAALGSLKWLNSKEYSNAQTNLHLRCSKGHEFKRTYNGLVRSSVCPKCPKLIKNHHKGKSVGYSEISQICIAAIAKRAKLRFHTATEGLGEFSVELTNGKKYYLDGYNEAYDIGIEFHGSFFHSAKDKRRKRYIDTVKRDECLKKRLSLYIVVWEYEWRANPELVIKRAVRRINLRKQRYNRL